MRPDRGLPPDGRGQGLSETGPVPESSRLGRGCTRTVLLFPFLFIFGHFRATGSANLLQQSIYSSPGPPGHCRSPGTKAPLLSRQPNNSEIAVNIHDRLFCDLVMQLDIFQWIAILRFTAASMARLMLARISLVVFSFEVDDSVAGFPVAKLNWR